MGPYGPISNRGPGSSATDICARYLKQSRFFDRSSMARYAPSMLGVRMQESGQFAHLSPPSESGGEETIRDRACDNQLYTWIY
jgi:hypothetical protein